MHRQIGSIIPKLVTIQRLEVQGTPHPSFQLLRRARGPFGPFWGFCPSSVGEGSKQNILFDVKIGPQWSKWVNIGQNRPEQVKIGQNNSGPKIFPKWSKNGLKMIPKWSRNGLKMISKFSQNGPKMVSKWSQNASKMLQKQSQNGSKVFPK